jgi:hypothetical protein
MYDRARGEGNRRGQRASLNRSKSLFTAFLYRHDVAAGSTTMTTPMEMLPTFEADDSHVQSECGEAGHRATLRSF